MEGSSTSRSTHTVPHVVVVLLAGTAVCISTTMHGARRARLPVSVPTHGGQGRVVLPTNWTASVPSTLGLGVGRGAPFTVAVQVSTRVAPVHHPVNALAIGSVLHDPTAPATAVIRDKALGAAASLLLQMRLDQLLLLTDPRRHTPTAQAATRWQQWFMRCPL